MRHFAWFDCLRCAAIFLVMLAHVNVLADATAGPLLVVAAAARFFQAFGWVGVDLFFVLSGFLVSGLLFDEHDRAGTIDLRRFLVRRGFKIIPSFYVLVLITAIYDGVVRGHVNDGHLVHDLLFLQSYRAGAWPHAWTLAVEVHFYLLLGLLMAMLARRNPAGWLAPLPRILAGVLIACFLARWLNSALQHRGFNYHRELEPSLLHLDVLAAGVLLRFLYQYRPRVLQPFQHSRLFWIAFGLLLVLPSALVWWPHPALLTALIPTANYLGFGLIVFQAAQLPYAAGAGRLLARPFDFLGKHSYGIYLWHLPVKEWVVDPLMRDRGFVYLGCYFAASLAVGTFFSMALEMPVLHLRNRLFPSNTDRKQSAVDRAANDALSCR
jgi:peptidoglycan/LPS O-acetylase OafA/YrhL